MCGRARLSSDVSEIKIAFGIPPERPTPNFPPSWNVAPTDTLPVQQPAAGASGVARTAYATCRLPILMTPQRLGSPIRAARMGRSLTIGENRL